VQDLRKELAAAGRFRFEVINRSSLDCIVGTLSCNPVQAGAALVVPHAYRYRREACGEPECPLPTTSHVHVYVSPRCCGSILAP